MNRDKGITLVALVITIIVLIILAGITLRYLVGNNGIIQKSKQAKQNMTNASDEEKEALNNIENLLEKIGEETPDLILNPERIPGEETEGAIQFSEPIWAEGKAKIDITTNTSYTIQHKINNTSVNNWNEGTTVYNLKHGDKVYARLTDGTYVGNESVKQIMDTTNPVIEEFVTTKVTGQSITVKVTAKDEQSGLKNKGTYVYYKNDEIVSTSSDNTYIYTDLTPNQNYVLKVEVLDNAENKISQTLEQKTDIAVAKIGDDTYPLLQEAIDAVQDKTQTEIILLQNVNESVTISSEKNIVLNLATYQLNSTGVTITNKGILGIMNGTVIGEIGTALKNVEGGNIIINNSTNLLGTSSTDCTIENGGYISFDGNVTATKSNTIVNTVAQSYLKINENAQITNTSKQDTEGNTMPTIYNFGTIEMVGGNITSDSGNCIYNREGATANVSGGNVIADVGNTIQNIENATLNITGTALIEGNGVAPIANRGIANISGGTVKAKTGNVIQGYPNSELNISGTASIQSTSTANPAVYSFGTTRMTGGSISANGHVAIANGGNMVLSAGNITAPSVNVIINMANLTIEGTVSIYGGGSNMPVVTNNGSTGIITVTGGTIQNNAGGNSVSKSQGTVNIQGGTQIPAA